MSSQSWNLVFHLIASLAKHPSYGSTRNRRRGLATSQIDIRQSPMSGDQINFSDLINNEAHIDTIVINRMRGEFAGFTLLTIYDNIYIAFSSVISSHNRKYHSIILRCLFKTVQYKNSEKNYIYIII